MLVEEWLGFNDGKKRRDHDREKNGWEGSTIGQRDREKKSMKRRRERGERR